jgi:hypothetical protein
MFPALLSIIVLVYDAREKRRLKTNSTLERPLKPPGKNWAKALEKRHPVSADGFMSLQNIIINQVAHVLDDTNRGLD